MSIIIGSARIDQNGHISGGLAGDQTGREVSTQPFYLHKKGWYVIRPISAEHADKIAKNMLDACNNKNLGYDQQNRYGIIKNGIHTKIKTECDCSSTVRACIKEATGIDPGDFNTESEPSALAKTKLFESKKTYTNGMALYNGDVLVTKTKGHTVIVVSGNPRVQNKKNKDTNNKIDFAQSFNKKIAKKYTTTANLNLRSGAGKNKKIIKVIPKGKTVICYGYYTNDWYLVTYNDITGFCSKNYLK